MQQRLSRSHFAAPCGGKKQKFWGPQSLEGIPFTTLAENTAGVHRLQNSIDITLSAPAPCKPKCWHSDTMLESSPHVGNFFAAAARFGPISWNCSSSRYFHTCLEVYWIFQITAAGLLRNAEKIAILTPVLVIFLSALNRDSHYAMCIFCSLKRSEIDWS